MIQIINYWGKIYYWYCSALAENPLNNGGLSVHGLNIFCARIVPLFLNQWLEGTSLYIQQTESNKRLISMCLCLVLSVSLSLLFLSILMLPPPSTPSYIFDTSCWIQYLFSLPSSSTILSLLDCLTLFLSSHLWSSLDSLLDYPFPIFLSWFMGLIGCNLCSSLQ